MDFIILASGLSSRMGTDKLFLKVGGSTLIRRTLSNIRSIESSENINLIVSKDIYKRNSSEFKDLIEEFDVNLILNKYDNRLTTNSATMNYAVEVGKFSGEEVVVIDSDLFIPEEDFKLLVYSPLAPDHTYTLYAGIKSSEDAENEYFIDSSNSIVRENTGSMMISFYKIKYSFLSELVEESNKDNMSRPYFDDYILEKLQNKIKYVSLRSTQEFDTVEDLLRSGILSLEELKDLIEKIDMSQNIKGMSNTTFMHDDIFIKIFNEETSSIVDRDFEVKTHRIFESFNLAPELIITTPYYSASRRVEGYQTKSRVFYNRLKNAISVIHKFAKVDTSKHHKMMDQLRKYKDRVGGVIIPDVEIERLIKSLDKSGEKLVLCHGDLVPENIIISEDGLKFIDFEYSCIRSPKWDIATLQLELLDEVEDEYLGYAIAVDYIWYVWSMMADKIGEYEGYGFERLRRARNNFQRYINIKESGKDE